MDNSMEVAWTILMICNVGMSQLNGVGKYRNLIMNWNDNYCLGVTTSDFESLFLSHSK